MAIYTKIGTAANDSMDLETIRNGNTGKPNSGDYYVWDGGAGSDTFYMSLADHITYLYLFNSSPTNFVIPAGPDASGTYTGYVTISGASSGGRVYNLELKDVEFLKLNNGTLSLPTVVDTTPPVLSTVVAYGSSIVITYTDDYSLDAVNKPNIGAFQLSNNHNVTAVTIAGKTVTLTLDTPVINGESGLTISYTDPTAGNDANAIQDAAGNDAASVSGFSVTNNSAPVCLSSTAKGSELVMTFNGTLDAVNAPLPSSFAVSNSHSVTGVTVDAVAKTVTLALSTPVLETETGSLTVTYTDPTTGNDLHAIQGADGIDVATITNMGVQISTNNLPTGSVTVTGPVAGTVTQNETLTATNNLADADSPGITAGNLSITYTWQADGIDIAGATGNTYTLTEAEVGKAITATATYTDGNNTVEHVHSAATGPVVNVNDTPTGSVNQVQGNGGIQILGKVLEGNVLVADTSTIADPDGLGTFTYQWQMTDGNSNTTDIVGATQSTYTVTRAAAHEFISVVVNYTDGHGTPEQLASAQQTAAVEMVNVGISQDGYLSNAVVWLDSNNDNIFTWVDQNNNGAWDNGEGDSWALTNSVGDFSGLVGNGSIHLSSAYAINLLANNPTLVNPVTTTDISTGATFVSHFVAPEGSAFVNPLTSLITLSGQTTAGITTPLSPTDTVLTNLGINTAIDWTALDPLKVAATSATSADFAADHINDAVHAFAVSAQIANIIDVGERIAAAQLGVTLTDQQEKALADAVVGNLAIKLAVPGNTLDSNAVVSAALQAGLTAVAAGVLDANASLETSYLNANITAVDGGVAALADHASVVTAVDDIVKVQHYTQTTFASDIATGIGIVVATTQGTIDTAVAAVDLTGSTIFVNHAPTGSVTITGTAATSSTLTVTNDLQDAEGMIGSPVYHWMADMLDGSPLQEIATGVDQFTLTQDQLGAIITVDATYTDLAGNNETATSLGTAAVVLGDITPPVVQTVDATKAINNAAGSLVITFDEAIAAAATANIEIHKGTATGQVVATYHTGDLMIDNVSHTLTLSTPTNTLTYGSHYVVTFGSAEVPSITDTPAGNVFTGIDPNTGTYTCAFDTIADPYSIASNFGVDAGPILVGLGGVGVLAWAFLI